MKNIFCYILFVLCSLHVFAQQQLDSIKKENVLVEFSFNPTLTSVFKQKTQPKLNTNYQSKEVKYQINSKRVRSDFNPNSPIVKFIEINRRPLKNYSSYIYGAFGVYANTELVFATTQKLDKKTNFGIRFDHENYQNGIDDTRVNNAHWHNKLVGFFNKKTKSLDWGAQILYDRNSVNWYGLNADILDQSLYDNLDFNQVYNTLKLEGGIAYKDRLVKNIRPEIQVFTDTKKSFEIDVNAKSGLDFFDTELQIQLLNGKFNQDYTNSNELDYSFVNLGAGSAYLYQAKRFNLKLAANVLLNWNVAQNNAKFLFLPCLEMSLPVVKSLMSLTAGVKSDFTQNTYASLVGLNNFVSPTLNILPTYTPLNVFLALQGKVTRSIHYNAEVSYASVENLTLFVHNNETNIFNKAYQLGNSFGVVYTNATVLSIDGDIKINITPQINLGAKGSLKKYEDLTEIQAWNLPNLSIESYVNYKTEKWFGQASVNILSQRKDLVNGNQVTVKGVFDANVTGGYSFNKQFKAHLNLYNLLNNKYNILYNYQVQGLQALVGFSYQF